MRYLSLLILMALLFFAASTIRAERWEKHNDTQYLLWSDDGQYLGCYDKELQQYYRCENLQLYPEKESPVALPAELLPANYGVDTKQIRSHVYSHKGKEVTRKQAFDILEKGLPSDKDKPYLTVIGNDEDRNKVLGDLANSPALSTLAKNFRLQDYAPTDWQVKDVGFVVGGKPTIYIQAVDGKVLHRQDVYAGPEKLAEALRKADPNYKPDVDPDLTKPKPILPSLPSLNFDFLKLVPSYIWAGIAALVAFSFARFTNKKA